MTYMALSAPEAVVIGTTGIAIASVVALSAVFKWNPTITSAVTAVLFFVGSGLAFRLGPRPVSLAAATIISAVLSAVLGLAMNIALRLGYKLGHWWKNRRS